MVLLRSLLQGCLVQGRPVQGCLILPCTCKGPDDDDLAGSQVHVYGLIPHEEDWSAMRLLGSAASKIAWPGCMHQHSQQQ